ncbi:MAG: porin [Planctomycetes bacterium]|nr:porin [Planctomycetota bacterium]
MLLAAVPAGAQDEGAPGPPAEEAPPVASLEERIAALEAERQADGALTRAVRAALDRVELSGFANALFMAGLARPREARKDAFPYRVNDTDHLTFSVPYCKLGVRREVEGTEWDVGFAVAVGVGRMVPHVFSLDPDFLGGKEINLVEGWAELQVPTPLTPIRLRAGRVYGWFGFESLDVPDNPNLSLSYFTNFTPFTHTGASLGFDLTPGLTYTQWVVNGWDLVVDDNDAKSYGGQLAWRGERHHPRVALNWLVGAERPADERDLRWLVQLDVAWRAPTATEFGAALHYGQEEGAALRGGTAKYGGAMLVVRQDVFTWGEAATLYVAGRVT